MKKFVKIVLSFFLCIATIGTVRAGDEHQSCKVRFSHGLPIPDPVCTPGAFDSTVTTLSANRERPRNVPSAFKTAMYDAYGVQYPVHNLGEGRTCNLDHLIPVVLGGTDTGTNVWPLCGPDNVQLKDRYFKQKERVNYYLVQQVREGKMDLAAARHGIQMDWTQYADKAKKVCQVRKCEF